MNCPTCGGDTCVYDSTRAANNIKRRRKCLACDYRFTTIEIDMDMYKAMQGPDLTPAHKAILAIIDAMKKTTRMLEEVITHGKE